jgi:MFS family permease
MIFNKISAFLKKKYQSNITPRDIKDITLLSLYAAIGWASLTAPIFMTILKSNLSNSILLGFILITRKLSKIGFDFPLGLTMDTFGSRKIMIASRILPIIYTICILSGNIYCMICAVILEGISLTTITGKIESRIYNILKTSQSELLLPKILTITYFVSDIVATIIGFIGASLFLLRNQYSIILILTLATALSCMAIVLILCTSKNDIYGTNKKRGMLDTVANFCAFIKQHYCLFSVLIFYSILNFFGLQFSYLANLIFIDAGMNPEHSVMTKNIERLAFAIGSIVAFFKSSKITLKGSSILWIIAILPLLICCITYQAYLIFATVLIYAFIYSTIELSTIRFFEANIPSKIRTSATSVITTFNTIFGIFGTMLISITSSYFNNSYHMAIIIFISICLLIMLICLPFLYRLNNRFENN